MNCLYGTVARTDNTARCIMVRAIRYEATRWRGKYNDSKFWPPAALLTWILSSRTTSNHLKIIGFDQRKGRPAWRSLKKLRLLRLCISIPNWLRHCMTSVFIVFPEAAPPPGERLRCKRACSVFGISIRFLKSWMEFSKRKDRNLFSNLNFLENF